MTFKNVHYAVHELTLFLLGLLPDTLYDNHHHIFGFWRVGVRWQTEYWRFNSSFCVVRVNHSFSFIYFHT